jgi:DNA-binding HxlR family transcriptional regulator
VEYSLTHLGRTLFEMSYALIQWPLAISTKSRPRASYDRREREAEPFD